MMSIRSVRSCRPIPGATLAVTVEMKLREMVENSESEPLFSINSSTSARHSGVERLLLVLYFYLKFPGLLIGGGSGSRIQN